MKIKRAYVAPAIQSEKVEIGVYGCYGSDTWKDIIANAINNWFTCFGGWCCD